MKSLLAALFTLALVIVAPSAVLADGAEPAEVGVEQRLGDRLPLDVPLLLPEGGEAPSATLLRGRPVVLVLAYSACPMLCNLVLREMVRAVRAAEVRPGRDYDLVTLSIDPAEPPDVAREARARLLSGSGIADEPEAWRYFLGTEASIRRMAGAVGFRFAFDARTKTYAHPAAAFVLTPDGRVSRYLLGLRHEPGALDDAVRAAAAGRIADRASSDAAATVCFELAPMGRSAQIVRWSLRGVGLGVLGGLAFGVAWLVRRRREP